MLIFELVASLFLKKHPTKKRGKKLNIYNILKFILTTITKSDATGTKINFFEFWFFCWVGNSTYYEHLKRYEAIQKKWARSNNCKSCKNFIQWANRHLTNITKNDAVGTKINFFEFWFFCSVRNLSFYYHLEGFQVVPKNRLVAAFWKLLSFLFLP